MRKTKWLYISGAIIFAIGIIIFILSMAIVGFSFDELGGVVENNTEISGDFNSIVIDTSTADLKIQISSDGKSSLQTRANDKIIYRPTVENGILTIKGEDNRKWYERMFDFGDDDVVLSLSTTQYESLSIKGSTGNIVISEGLAFAKGEIAVSTADVKIESSLGNLTVSISTGDFSMKNTALESLNIKGTTGDIILKNIDVSKGAAIELTTGDISLENINMGGALGIVGSTSDLEMKNVKAQSLNAKLSTGEMELEGVVIDGEMKLKTSTGDMELEGCDASSLKIESSSGDVSGVLLTSKIFYATSSTGDISVPKSTQGGLCEVVTSSGDIEFKIAEKN